MALNENLHIINGTLGKDAEKRITSSEAVVTSVNVATSHWDGKENVTTWHRGIILGRQAEYIGNYGKKGGEIALKGRVQTREYDDKNGIKRYVTETVCFDADLPKVGKGDSWAGYDGGYTPAKQAPASDFSDMDDDIPF